MATVTPTLLTTEDVARILGMSIQGVNDLRYRGKGPKYVKLGHRSVRYRPEDVDDFIADRVTVPGE